MILKASQLELGNHQRRVVKAVRFLEVDLEDVIV
jgi:hypothetical protein